MQIFVKDPSGLTQSLYVEDGSLVADLKNEVAMRMELPADDMELQFGIQTLPNEEFLAEFGLVEESVITVHMPLDGGKKTKHKKKKYETPRKIKHKHLKRPKALLEYFTVDESSGKVKRLKQESPNSAGSYMAEHPDRYTCGKTGTMFYKLTADGKRLPIPKQKAVVKAVVAVVKAPVKKKKK
jgi:small subunit ribosomal protein S27Ae